jgi:acetylornithine/succinyldiaminopimelate/putrescine aminotransferase
MHLSVYGEFVQAPQVLFAQKLISVLPKNLESVYFVNSGAEATEGALKLAKRYTGRRKIISSHKAYHGSTHGALSVMGNDYFKKGYEPLLPEISFIRFNDDSDLEQIDEHTACVILETIQGEAGVIVPNKDYLKKVRQRCSETGALLILDEIQTGFGRTGTLFAFESFEIVPDILLLAKGIGGGMPIGAFVSSREIMSVFSDNPILGHITTFGGHPVCCAAGLATLDIILEQQLMAGIDRKEHLFRTLLSHPSIKEIRGKGLMLSVQLETFDQVEYISKQSTNKGVIIDWFLHCDTALRIAPPLVITEGQIQEACEVILSAIGSWESQTK